MFYLNPYQLVPHIRVSMLRETDHKWTLPERTIGDHEFVLILEGYGSFTINSIKYDVKKGMLFYFYPGLIHSGMTEPRNPMSFYAVHFHAAHVEYSGGAWLTSQTDEPLPIPFIQELKNSYLVQDLLKKVNSLWNEKGPGYELITRALFQEVLFHVINDTKRSSFNYSAYQKVEKVIQMICENPSKRYSLSELSISCGYTIPYFSKVFKEINGYTPIEYINKIKIDRAKELLIDEDILISEAASRLGFSDEFYFSRLFKKLEGISPTEYRQKR